jgi:hypothetical protein
MTVSLFSKRFIDVPQESAWKLLRSFVFTNQGELDLMNVSQ